MLLTEQNIVDLKLTIGENNRLKAALDTLKILTIGFLIQKKTTIGKMSFIVGHLCPEKNDDNIVGTHDRQ